MRTSSNITFELKDATCSLLVVQREQAVHVPLPPFACSADDGVRCARPLCAYVVSVV